MTLRIDELREEKARREKRELDRYEMARECGINYSNLFYYCTGESNPTLKTMLTLSRYFGVTLDELLYERKKA